MTLQKTISRACWRLDRRRCRGLHATGGASQSEHRHVFEGARLITGDGTPVENRRSSWRTIASPRSGRAGEVQVPADATRVSLAGKTVMPAFVDLHSHVGFENATTATEEKENYTRENLIDHMERYAYTRSCPHNEPGFGFPDEFVWQVRDDSRGDTSWAPGSSRSAADSPGPAPGR